MRIVHLDTGRELRGGQRQLLLLARKLRERGHGQLVVCPEECALELQLRENKFEVFVLPRNRLGSFGGMHRLRRQIRSGAFQVLHAHDGRGQTVSALASLGLPVRRVATRRVTFMPRGLQRALGVHRLQYGPTCDAIIAVSNFIRDLLVQSRLRASKIEVIPDGVEIPAALPDAAFRNRARRDWGFEPEAFVIGHAGAFTREKGQDILLEAFLQVLNTMPQARLLLAGEGPLRALGEVAELLRRAGSRARIIDPMEDLTPFFAAIDVYAMPSRAEGLGSSALLAMAHGLPLVASRVGGLSEVVAEGETGWLVPPASASALADGLVMAASRPEILRRFGAAARQRVAAFSDDTMVNRTEALYRRLVATAG
ncbi:MAG TPA: glycosyltransferase family 4 protein [Terriglobia bacterium]|nr:glycosyltransferase family 4 protein [Terriglobia bacterium]